jgi:plasmid stabilization system protein ParE
VAKSFRYEVTWSEPAAEDLEHLIDFISQNNPTNAQDVLKTIRNRAATLSFLPNRGRVVPELKAIGIENYRELIISPYRLFFQIKGKQVYVLAVLDGRRDLENLLFERLTRSKLV